MLPDVVFYRDLAYVFVAAVLGGVLARLARQPLILGYVVGGIFVSPLTPGPAVSDLHTFELFAEIGVILLMFSSAWCSTSCSPGLPASSSSKGINCFSMAL